MFYSYPARYFRMSVNSCYYGSDITFELVRATLSFFIWHRSDYTIDNRFRKSKTRSRIRHARANNRSLAARARKSEIGERAAARFPSATVRAVRGGGVDAGYSQDLFGARQDSTDYQERAQPRHREPTTTTKTEHAPLWQTGRRRPAVRHAIRQKVSWREREIHTGIEGKRKREKNMTTAEVEEESQRERKRKKGEKIKEREREKEKREKKTRAKDGDAGCAVGKKRQTRGRIKPVEQ